MMVSRRWASASARATTAHAVRAPSSPLHASPMRQTASTSAGPSGDSSPANPHTAQVPRILTSAAGDAGRAPRARGARSPPARARGTARAAACRRRATRHATARRTRSAAHPFRRPRCAVRRPGDRAQPASRALDRLVVKGVDVELLLAEQPSQSAVALEATSCVVKLPRRVWRWNRSVDVIGEVLVQAPTAGHVEHLHAPADPDTGMPCAARGAGWTRSDRAPGWSGRARCAARHRRRTDRCPGRRRGTGRPAGRAAGRSSPRGRARG